MAWKDIDISFEKNLSGDIRDSIDDAAIENSLSNIFSTILGSRRMLIDFAAITHGFIFEPVDQITSNSIATLILGAIKIWEPRINVKSLNVFADPDSNKYICSLFYTIARDESDILRFDYAI